MNPAQILPMTPKAELIKTLLVKNPDVVLFDDRTLPALIGIGYVGNNAVAIYSKKMLLSVINNFEQNTDAADEYYAWHFLGLRAGVNTPVIFDDTYGAA